MIGSVAEFARYFDGVRRRTWSAVDRVGPELLGWAWRMEDVVARVARGGEPPQRGSR
ncbi:MAG TPA: hypothetical protein VN323_01760 [Candidatus Dormibacteraeota bacterium]|jgi:hypothetical protein|nr:hypothetical protein [Candidatus Dormibacteraeota bacterium]